ncbi:hypothetical protein ACEQPO_25630 [Bacillus sp. SL00103]
MRGFWASNGGAMFGGSLSVLLFPRHPYSALMLFCYWCSVVQFADLYDWCGWWRLTPLLNSNGAMWYVLHA